MPLSNSLHNNYQVQITKLVSICSSLQVQIDEIQQSLGNLSNSTSLIFNKIPIYFSANIGDNVIKPLTKNDETNKYIMQISIKNNSTNSTTVLLDYLKITDNNNNIIIDVKNITCATSISQNINTNTFEGSLNPELINNANKSNIITKFIVSGPNPPNTSATTATESTISITIN